MVAVEPNRTRSSGGPLAVDMSDDVITIDEVSRRLSIPKPTLYRWRHFGTGPRSHRVGKHLRYRWSEVLAWLDAQE